MTGVGRDDLLSTAIAGGFLLGAAAARRDEPGYLEHVVGAVLRSCGDLAKVDPVMARVLEEKARAVLHGRAKVPDGPRPLGPGDRVLWTCGACGAIGETPLDGPEVEAAVSAAHAKVSPDCDGSIAGGTILGRVMDPAEASATSIERGPL